MLIIFQNVSMSINPRHLKAKNRLPLELGCLRFTQFIKLDDIQNLAGLSDFVHGRVSESLPKHGMLWPIIVCRYENYWDDKIWKVGLKDVEFSKDKWGVTNGNQRVYFARENGYRYIEAVEVKSQEERDIINKIIYINPYKYPT